MIKSLLHFNFTLILAAVLGSFFTSPCLADNNRALLIGISQYKELDCLAYADRDAIEFADILSNFGEYQPSTLTMILNNDATKKGIQRAFEDLIKKSTQEPIDHLIVAYSGHGMPRRLKSKKTSIFLAPNDASITDNKFYISDYDTIENDTFITRGWLARQIASIKAKKAVLVLDSCYSGIADFGKIFARNLGIKIKFKKLLVSEKGIKTVVKAKTAPKSNREVAFLAASSETQPSTELDLLKHGAMSYCILKYLEAVRLATENDAWHVVPVSDLFSAIFRIFNNFNFGGRKLRDMHQPMLFSIPSYESVAGMKFLEIKGTKRNTDQTGIVQLNTDPPGALVFIDGKEFGAASRGFIELPIGKHRIALVLPDTNYSHYMTEHVKEGQLIYKMISLHGDLSVNSFWEEKNQQEIKLTPGPKLDIYLDNRFVGQTELHLSGINAGTHTLAIKYKKKYRKRKIEIRPNSPLRVRFVLNRQKMKKAVGVGKRLPF